MYGKGKTSPENTVMNQFGLRDGRFYRGWLALMGVNVDQIENIGVQKTSRLGCDSKADVLLLIDDDVEWISVKKITYRPVHIDGGPVDQYVEDLEIPDQVADTLRKYCGEEGFRPSDILSKSQLLDVRSSDRFMMDEVARKERDALVGFLNGNARKITRRVVRGTGRAQVKWMMVLEEGDSEWSPGRSTIVSATDAVNALLGEASITEHGHIRLGGLTIQSGKKGRGKKSELQFKFSPEDVFSTYSTSIII